MLIHGVIQAWACLIYACHTLCGAALKRAPHTHSIPWYVAARCMLMQRVIHEWWCDEWCCEMLALRHVLCVPPCSVAARRMHCDACTVICAMCVTVCCSECSKLLQQHTAASHCSNSLKQLTAVRCCSEMLQCVAAAQCCGVLLQCVVVLSIYQCMYHAGSVLLQSLAAISIFQCMDRAGSVLLQCVAAISIYQCMDRAGNFGTRCAGVCVSVSDSLELAVNLTVANV